MLTVVVTAIATFLCVVIVASVFVSGAEAADITFDGDLGIDKFVYEVFFEHISPQTGHKVVLEAGAYDGVYTSNSLAFEKYLGWRSICIEANPRLFAQLKKNRPGCKCIRAGLGAKDGVLDFVLAKAYGGFKNTNYNPRITRRRKNTILRIRVQRLSDLLNSLGVHIIDFFSLDVEGGELEVLKGVDFKSTKFNVIVAESFTRTHTEKRKSTLVRCLLESNGYIFVGEIARDYVFVHSDYMSIVQESYCSKSYAGCKWSDKYHTNNTYSRVPLGLSECDI